MKSDAIESHTPHSACDTVLTSQAMRGRVTVDGQMVRCTAYCNTGTAPFYSQSFHDYSYCPAPSHYFLDCNGHCSDSVISYANQDLAIKVFRIA
jgi:hypothetical protein